MECTENIWKEYHDRLGVFILSRVNDKSVADDVLQEVFVRIHSQINSLKDSGKLQSWIYQITRNAIIDHYRSQKKIKELSQTLTAKEPGLSDEVREDIQSCLMPMIENLPEPYREAVILSEIQGLAQKEVAQKQGISLSGAKSRIQRGRKMIKEMMLGCCYFEFDRRGNVVNYERRGNCQCDAC